MKTQGSIPVQAMLQSIFWSLTVFLLASCLTGPAEAIILYGTGSTTANTTAPSGSLANSGWQYQATMGDYLCTPISSNVFITAGHIAGTARAVSTVRYQGVDYPVVSSSVITPTDPNVDLALGRINGTFPSFAPLSTRDIFRRVYLFQSNGNIQNLNTAPSQTTVGLGRGYAGQGSPLYSDPAASPHSCTVPQHLCGWLHGSTYDKAMRWGSGRAFCAYVPYYGPPAGLDPSNPSQIYKPFAGESFNDFGLTVGDSGGAFFVSDQGQWRLAGINSTGTEGSYSGTGGSQFVAVFNGLGLISVAGTQICTTDDTWYQDRGGCADVQYNLAWIYSYLGKIRLNRPNYDPSLGFGFEIGGLIQGTTLTIETSSDLQTWQTFATASPQSFRSFFADSPGNLGSARFYRVRSSNGLRSENCVGVYRLNMNNSGGANAMTQIIANQFISYHGDTLNALIPTAPVGTVAQKYDPTTQQYASSTYIGGGNSPWSTDMSFAPGEGFWITIPAHTSLSMAFYGEVPLSFSRTIYPGQNLISLPIPQSGLPSPSYNFSPIFGDTIYRYVNGAYQSLTYIGGWSPNSPAQVGEGFWYNSGTSSPFNWTYTFSIWYPN